MCPGLDDMPLLHHDDLIRVANGGEAVRDDETGAVAHQLHHSVLDMQLGAGINRGGCFIQNQNLRIAEKRSADGKKLALALRKIRAGGGEHRIIAIGQCGDDLVTVGALCGFNHLLVGYASVSILEIVSDRVGEENRVLQHDTDRIAQNIGRNITDVHSVNGDTAAVNVIKAHEEIDDSGLTGAGRSHQRDFFPRFDTEVEVINNLLAGDVAEIDVLKLDDAFCYLKVPFTAGVLTLGIQNGEVR